MQQLFKENCCWYAGERQLPNKNIQKRETPELSAEVLERTLVNRAYQLTRTLLFLLDIRYENRHKIDITTVL